jgi:transcriptional regulator with XRE-family HTH domain
MPRPGPDVAHGVREIRTKLGLSQEAFAQILGVAVRTIARWEQNETAPSSLGLSRLRAMDDVRERLRRLFPEDEGAAWLQNPNLELGGQPPLHRIRAPGGLEEVRDLLGRMEWSPR